MTAAIIAILCVIAAMLIRAACALSTAITHQRDATTTIQRQYKPTRMAKRR